MKSSTVISIIAVVIIVVILLCLSGGAAYYEYFYTPATTTVPAATTASPAVTTVAPTVTAAVVTTAVPSKTCSVLSNIRLPGGGFLQGSSADQIAPYPSNAQTASDCRLSCQNSTSCKQYVYTGKGQCYMMNQSYPNYSSDTSTYAGGQSGIC